MSGNIANAADTACKDGFCQFTAVKAVYPALYRLDSALYRRCFILRRRCQKISFCKSIVRTEQRIGTIQHGFKLAADAVVIDRGGKHQHSRL